MLESAVEDTYFVGIDGGGSKCKALLETAAGKPLSNGLGGPANPLHGISRAKESILTAVSNALAAAGLNDSNLAKLVVGVGLAGANLPGMYSIMSNWENPFKAMYLTTDLNIACLGAHQGGSGAVIIVGTGSCGYANINGQILTLGAHGFMLGDKGSGAWLGLEAIKAMLLADDDLGPRTILTALIEEKFKQSTLDIIETLFSSTSSTYANLAPLVFKAAKQHDPVATAIVKEGSSYIEAIAHKLLALNPPRLSMIGGISPLIMERLSESVTTKITAALGPPEQGALHFARTQYNHLT